MKKLFIQKKNKRLATSLLCGVCVCVFNNSSHAADDVKVFNPTEDTTSSEIISDNGSSMSIVKNSSATQTLTGNNTYTGSTTISDGTLALSGTGGISTSSGVHDNAAFNISGVTMGSSSIQSLDGAGTVALGNNTLNITNGNTTFGNKFSGVMSGSGGLTVSGGTETLTGANTYTGLTDVSSGAGLNVSDGGSLAGTAAMHDDGSVTLSDGSVSMTSKPTDKNHGQILVGITSGSSASMNVENGSTITAKNTYIQAGWAAGSTGTITVDGHSTINSNLLLVGEQGRGIVTIEGASSATAAVVGLGNSKGSTGQISVTGNDSTLTAPQELYVNLDGSGTVSVSDGGVISAGSISFGDGASNSQAGTLTVGQDGTLAVDGAGGIVADEGSNGSYQFNLSGGTLKDTGSNLTSSVNATLVDDTSSTVDTNGLNTTLSGVLSGNGNLTVSDTSGKEDGILTLMGNNTYTGSTTISDGTLALSGTGGISTSSGVHDNAAFNISGVTMGSSSIQSLDGAGTVALGNNTLNITNGNTTFGNKFSGVMSGSGGLTVSGGTETLTGANTYTGSTTISGGTLQLGDGGTTGDVSGSSAIHDNGTLDVDHSNTLTLSQTIDGTGGLVQKGTGTTILTGSNTYTGGTTVSSGEIDVGTSDALGSGILSMADDTTLGFVNNNLTVSNAIIFTGSNDPTINTGSYTEALSGSISGASAMTKSGSGTLILTGSNSYTGSTTISGGTLQLGDGGTTGDVSGSSAIHDNGTLAVDHSNTLTLSQTIDGTGGLVQKGTGTTILTGSNTYTGGTTVSSGTLVGSTSNFGSGTITNHASLTLDQDTDGTLANVLEGDGLLSKTGNGTVNIDGDDSKFTGLTIVDSGSISVYGLLSNSDITVNSGATLSGTGTVGTTTVASGGTLSPAGSGSIGTININGDLTMSSGSVLSMDGTASETGTVLHLDNKSYSVLSGDLVKVSGLTDINGVDIELKIDYTNYLKNGQAYQLIYSNGGIYGKFKTLNTNINYPFISPYLIYTSDSVDLLLQRNNMSFSEAGSTRNQQETGRGMDHLSAGSSVVQAMEPLNRSEARKALDSLSGEIHASARTAMIEDAFFVRDAALDRLALADCDGAYSDNTIMTAAVNKKKNDGKCYSDRAVFWGEAYGSLGRNFGNGNAATMNHTTAGFIMGVDTPFFETGRIGALVGYGSSTYTTSSGRDSSGHSNNVTLGVYGSNHWGNLYLNLGASYTWDMMNTQRTAIFDGYQGSRLSSSYLGGTAQAFGELGYKMHGKSMVFEPFARVAYVNMMTNAFHEHGGLDALDGSKTDTGVTFSTFGFRASKTMKSGNMFVTPHVMMGYRHAYGLTTSTTHETFAAAGVGNMDISGVPLAANSAVLNAGFSVKASDRLNMGLSYVGQYAVQSIDNGVRFRLTYKY